MTENPPLGPCTPFFIISDLDRSLSHYVGKLGFECIIKSPANDPFFSIVGRGSAQVMLKMIGEQVAAVPNHLVHEWAPWDAFVFTADPDALAREFASREVVFHREIVTSDDGLYGFAVADPDRYVCYFGRPV